MQMLSEDDLNLREMTAEELEEPEDSSVDSDKAHRSTVAETDAR